MYNVSYKQPVMRITINGTLYFTRYLQRRSSWSKFHEDISLFRYRYSRNMKLDEK